MQETWASWEKWETFEMCKYANDGHCDEPTTCERGTDGRDCGKETESESVLFNSVSSFSV